MSAVDKVLREIGAGDVPQIVIWNKIDATAASPGVERDEHDKLARVRLSARTGAGLDLLRNALAEVAQEHSVQRDTTHAPPEADPARFSAEP